MQDVPVQAVSLEHLRVHLEEDKSPFMLRTSDRILFKRCRRLWGWLSHLRQGRRNRENADYLWFGTGIHYALEDFHGLNLYGHPSRSFQAYVEACRRAGVLPATWQEHLSLGIVLMTYYAEEWLSCRPSLQTYEVEGIPQVEVNGAIDLGVRTRDGRRVLYGFTMDRITIDEWGRLWVQEYKTAKQIRTQPLDVDEQVTAYCTPTSTEILTRSGWKLHHQLIIGEEALAYSHEANRLEWTTLEDVHRPGSFPTVTVSNKSFEFVCTPDHKWAQVNLDNKVSGEEGKFELKPIQGGRQHHYVVLSAPYEQGTSSVTPDEAAVIAWLLGDGTYTLGVNIAQSRTKYAAQIQELLDRFPDCYSRISDRSGCNVWHLREPFFRQLWNKAGLDLELNGWEQFLLGLSPKAIKSFCDAAMMAEGDQNGSFYQNRGRKQELFRLAFFLSGVFPTKGWPSGKGEGSFPNRGICEAFVPGTPRKWVRTIKVTPNEGKQEVWCPQTSLGTWVMRQNGQIAITGNCWAAWRLYGVQVAGVVYQQFIKRIPALPKVLATGKVSTDVRQATSASLYAKLLVDMYGGLDTAPNENIIALNKIRMTEDEDKDRFIVRHRVERNERQLISFEQKVLMELEDIANPNLPLYPNATKDCDYMCPLQAACIAMDDGSDWESVLDSYTIATTDGLTQREKEQMLWRNQLPEPHEVQQLLEGAEYSQLLSQLPELPEDNQLSPEEVFSQEIGLG